MLRRSPAWALALGLALTLPRLAPAQSTTQADEQLLKTAGIRTDAEGLVQFFRERTIREQDRPGLQKAIAQLQSSDERERVAARLALARRGRAVVPLLKEAAAGQDSAELRKSIEGLLLTLEKSSDNELVAAAGRLVSERGSEDAVPVLLDAAAASDDAWVQEELFKSLGRMALPAGRPDGRLLHALEGSDVKLRAAAVYVLGRRGDAGQRAAVRPHLEDADPLVRERAAQGLFGKRHSQDMKDAAAADEALLKTHGVPLTETGLLAFLSKRTLSSEDQARLSRLVSDLGSATYIERHVAAQLLAKEGPAALAYLKPAEYDPDPEVARRAQRCVEEIRAGPGPALPIAAVRALARPGMARDNPPAAFRKALLDYVPFADDEAVEEEVLHALTLLSLRETKIDPALTAALADAQPARRAAAAFVLGHVGTESMLPGVRKLLADEAPLVRLRAAQGLLSARDRAAVPALIALLADVPAGVLWKLEETLYRLAGDAAVADSALGLTPEGKQKAVKAWQQWWLARGDAVDLARAAESDGYLGLVAVVEYDSHLGGELTGQVWEAPLRGPTRWKIGNLVGAMDAHVLPNGRVLVAENSAGRVTERDVHGEVRWEVRTPGGNAICCQRLPNGNTFIAMYNQLMEVRPDKSLVYSYTPGPQFYIFSAQKTPQGTVVCMTAQGKLLELDPVARKEVRTIPLGFPAGGWCSVEALPNGRFLIATMNNNGVREIDAEGRTHWSATYAGVFRATKLPSGNVLVASMTTRKVAELDRTGSPRWERTCEGRPWNVHYR